MPSLRNPEHLSGRLEHAPRHAVWAGTGQPGHDARDPAWMQRRAIGLAALRHTEVLGHAGDGAGSDRVDRNAVATELANGDDGEGGDAGLGGTVVRLSRVAVGLTPFPARDYRPDPCYEAGQCPM